MEPEAKIVGEAVPAPGSGSRAARSLRVTSACCQLDRSSDSVDSAPTLRHSHGFDPQGKECFVVEAKKKADEGVCWCRNCQMYIVCAQSRQSAAQAL